MFFRIFENLGFVRNFIRKRIVMPHTYTQIYIHAVFAVKNRVSLIDKSWRERLHQYMGGVIRNHGHSAIAIGGVGDHVHILFGLRPAQTISNIMQHVKGSSSEWINKERLTSGKFEWQGGYGAFSYAKSQIPVVRRYIENQERHHRKKSFIEEYKQNLKDFGVEYKNEFIFHSVN
jgi:REP element-mobilizing transposase RayT